MRKKVQQIDKENALTKRDLFFLPSTILFLLVCIAAGSFFSYLIVDHERRNLERNFLSSVRILGATLDIQDVKALTGSLSDQNKPEYLRLQKLLTRVVDINERLTYAYLMGRRDGKVVFLVENIERNPEAEESFPGSSYQEASQELQDIFTTGKGFVEGPLADRWGMWVSAIIPIKDPQTNKILAAMGVDIEADLWEEEINEYKALAIAISAFFFGMIFLTFYFFQSQRLLLARMRVAEKRFRLVTNSSGDWIWETDRAGRYTYSNRAVKKILGYEISEIIGKKYFYDFGFSKDREHLKKKAAQEIIQNRDYIHEVDRRQHKDGHEVILDIKGFAVRDKKGEIVGYRGIDRDVTASIRAAETIRRERNFISAIFDIIGALVVVLDTEGRIVRFNRTCEWITGYRFDEVKDKYVWDMFIPDGQIEQVKDVFNRLKKGERSNRNENYWVTKEGEKRLILWSNTTLANEYVIATGIDITEQRRAEKEVQESREELEQVNKDLAVNEKLLKEMVKDLQAANLELQETQNQLIQSQKIASIGVVASGIAHEIKNPLAIIMQSMERVAKILEKTDGDNTKYVKRICNAAERANQVVSSLLMFSRESEMRMAPVRIQECIDRAVELMDARLKDNKIKLIREYKLEDDDYVNGDAIMLQQVFFNLFVNASDALPREGGEISISTFVERPADAKNPGCLIIEFADNGEGINEEDKSRIFDPFFTTKEPGQGTGLGLSIIFLILDRHGGSIDVETKKGEGAKFIIKLPLLSDNPEKNNERS